MELPFKRSGLEALMVEVKTSVNRPVFAVTVPPTTPSPGEFPRIVTEPLKISTRELLTAVPIPTLPIAAIAFELERGL
jgi:hypothetical protein